MSSSSEDELDLSKAKGGGGRFAGGREVTLGELQAMGMTAGINALIVGNYLTTLGRSPDEDLQMLEDLKMPIGALSKVV